jgi:hypothetical protein
MYPQVTLGNSIGNESSGGNQANTNAASLIFCLKAIQAIKEAGFPGVSLWYGYDAQENMLSAVKTMRTARR